MQEKDIYQFIIEELAGVIDYENSQLLSSWLNESDENKKTYAKIRDIMALERTANYVALDKRRAYRKITRPNRSLKIIASISVAAAFIISFGIWNYNAPSKIAQIKEDVKLAQSSIDAQEDNILVISDGNAYEIINDSDSIDFKTEKPGEDGKMEIVQSPQNNPVKIVENKVCVPHGRICKIQLSDGTEVLLNAKSTLTFASQFIGSRREVSLDGEAIFNVVHDPSKRFVVKTSKGETRVYGTYFNVKAYQSDSLEYISLISGSVVVGNKLVEQILKPGEQATIVKDSTIRISVFAQDEILGWEHSLFVFEDKPLEEIIPSLERWYNVEFKFNDEKLKELCAYVKIKKSTSLEELLKVISSTNKVKFELVGEIINIYPN